ncbi:MAG: hypothetical protein P4L22_01235, partial [Candidatus Babeliales bacterium]|nr:hypothetical protein [Candidatus Babeliales bacterium]
MKHEFLLFLLLSISGYITSSQVATELTDAAIEKGMLENTLKCHAKLQTPIEDYSKSPLTTSMKFMLGEVAMYNADRWLETNMVPPVVIRKETAHDDEEDKDVEILSLCSYWVERSDIEVKSTDELKKLVTDTEWSQMNILYFLFGQYDRNLDGQIRSKETGKLYLTDNEAIANVNQFVVGYSPDKNISCPWAPARINTELSTEGEPENFLDVINSKQDPKKIHEAFDKYVDIWTKRDIDNNCCRMWKQRLWRQFYLMAKYICAPFS